MIFTKEIDKISWNDIELFCKQGIPEGQTIDYKKDFPRNIAKTISAFANTIGGIVLIGIEENSDNRPKIPINGLEYKRGFSERVISIIMDNITPPIFPEIGVIKNENKEKAVILIRIPESENTPHAVDNNTKVYCRTLDRNHPEKLVDLSKLVWLFNRREKSVSFRTELIQSASDRYNYRLKLNDFSTKLNSSTLSFAMIPLFPKSEMLISPPKLKEIRSIIEVREYYGTSIYFPIPEDAPLTLLDNGISIEFLYENMIYYTEIKSFGLYYYKQLLEKTINWLNKERKIIRISEVIIRLDEYVDSVIKLYDSLGYNGNLYFEAKFENLGNIELGLFPGSRINKPTGNDVNRNYTLTISKLKEDKNNLILKVVEPLCWNYNWNINIDNIIGCLKKYKK